jgi:hypothetical protein
MDIDLELPGSSKGPFTEQIRVTALSFHRFEQYHASDRTLIRHASTIQSGTLHLEGVGGTRHPLRAGEGIRFERVHGVIRMLELEGQQAHVQFRGHVRGMQTGWGESERSLMPSYLEWLEARHGLYLLWGSTLYIFGLVAGLMRWWGIRV